jgi:hypothetical protein
VHHPYRSAIQSCCLSTRVALARLAPPPGGYRSRALADRGTAYSVRRARSLPCSEHVIFDQVEFGERRESPEDLVGRASEDVWRGKGVEQEVAADGRELSGKFLGEVRRGYVQVVPREQIRPAVWRRQTVCTSAIRVMAGPFCNQPGSPAQGRIAPRPSWMRKHRFLATDCCAGSLHLDSRGRARSSRTHHY